MPQKGDEIVDLTLDYVHETDLAWLVSDGDKKVWLPKALVERDGDVYTIPTGIAREKGLI
jgi:hypothetical protein